MQPSDSHTDFKVRLENRSTRDQKLVGLLPRKVNHMGIALLKLILHIRALPYRQLSLALFTVGENVVALSSPP